MAEVQAIQQRQAAELQVKVLRFEAAKAILPSLLVGLPEQGEYTDAEERGRLLQSKVEAAVGIALCAGDTLLQAVGLLRFNTQASE
jgi:hypothetical protein